MDEENVLKKACEDVVLLLKDIMSEFGSKSQVSLQIDRLHEMHDTLMDALLVDHYGMCNCGAPEYKERNVCLNCNGVLYLNKEN